MKILAVSDIHGDQDLIKKNGISDELKSIADKYSEEIVEAAKSNPFTQAINDDNEDFN